MRVQQTSDDKHIKVWNKCDLCFIKLFLKQRKKLHPVKIM